MTGKKVDRFSSFLPFCIIALLCIPLALCTKDSEKKTGFQGKPDGTVETPDGSKPGEDGGTTSPDEGTPPQPDGSAPAEDGGGTQKDAAVSHEDGGGPVERKKVLKISAGMDRWCGVLSDGTVRCNNMGGTFAPVPGINNAIDVEIGAEDTPSCVLLDNGKIKCWGMNSRGALGDGTETLSDMPVEVLGIDTAKMIAAGQRFACALLSDGAVKCWGDNGWGQLGNGEWQSGPDGIGGAVIGPEMCNDGVDACSKTPVAVPGISGATYIAAGPNFACALLEDATVKCWGGNIAGLLGTGTDIGPIEGGIAGLSITPVAVAGLANVAMLKGGWWHACAVLKDGTLKCWGSNNFGNLGLGSNTGPDECRMATIMLGGQNCALSPAQVPGISNAADTAVNPFTSCAGLSDGKVKCWGRNDTGEVGNGTDQPSYSPADVIDLENVVDVEAGFDYFLALLSDGTVMSWGTNTNSRLGLGQNSSDGPETCGLMQASCSKSPRPVSKTLYGEQDAPPVRDGGSGPWDGGLPWLDGGSAACAPGEVQGSCIIPGANMCNEYSNFPEGSVAGLQNGCTSGGGSWSASACPDEDKVGGCQMSPAGLGYCTTSWYYTSVVPPGQYKSICENSGGFWLNP